MARPTRLRYLNISQNAFETFPDTIVGMAGLIELRANDNRLTVLPAAISGLARLR